MKYLISGGAGFVGSHVVDELIKRGDEVAVMDNLSTGKREYLHPRVPFYNNPIEFPVACCRCMHDVDVVIHLAALASAPRSIESPRDTFEVNVVGTHNILMAAREAGVKRVVFASSASYYGYCSCGGDAISEDQPPAPVSPYAASKVIGETIIDMFREVYGLSTVSLRYFNMYGPRRMGDTDYAAVVPKFIGQAMRGESLTVHGDGEQKRDMVFIDDAVRVTLAMCDADVGGAFNVCTGGVITINEVAREVIESVGADVDMLHVEPRAGDVRGDAGDNGKLMGVLGDFEWTDWRDGLAKTVEWHRGLSG